MYCVYCGVRLQDGAEQCPLCSTPVVMPRAPGREGEVRTAPALYPDRLPEEKKRGRGLLVWLLTTVLLAVCLSCLILCLNTCRRVDWSGYVLMSSALAWIWFLFPMLFLRWRPMIFLPLDIVCLAGYLLYICLKTGGGWFLSFAFPVTMIAGLLLLLGVALFRYLKQGRLRLLGLYLILIGGSCMLVEFFGHITFGWPMFNWSLYCVSVFGLLGLFLFIATLIPPMRDYLRRTFFF